jgi:hypothetical protein
MNKKKRILIVASADGSLQSFRGDFIKAIISEGYEVYTAAPEIHQETRDFLISIDAIPIEFELQRSGLNPIKDLQTINSLKKLITKYKIDLVFPYTIKLQALNGLMKRIVIRRSRYLFSFNGIAPTIC